MKIPKIIQEYKETDAGAEGETGLEWRFSQGEIRALVKFLRQGQNSVPAELRRLQEALEQKIYDTMTISQARDFFSQGKK